MMQKSRSARRKYPEIELFIRMPAGLIPLDDRSEALPLPLNPALESPPFAYGPYLRAVAGYFSLNSFRKLKDLLEMHPRPTPNLDSAASIRLVSEKHGALYSVSRLQVRFSARKALPAAPAADLTFAVNAAFLPEQRAFLAVEYRLLKYLHKHFQLNCVPRPLLSGKTRREAGAAGLEISLFAGEWFEAHHEFHLSSIGGEQGIKVWKPGENALYLSGRQSAELYEQAAGVLTACLDTRFFRQIYPWHHGAGDFVVDESRTPLSVKLITARNYRSLLTRSAARDKMLGSLHFFANLSIRMRIDRLDGTGPLAWAGPECLGGVVRGFCKSWEKKMEEDDELPGALAMLSLFLRFSPEERLAFIEIAARHGQVEFDETAFLESRLPEHARELSSAVKDFLSDAAK